MKKKIVVISIALLAVISLAGCGCKESNPKVGLGLEIWGVNDESDAYGKIFKNYTKINPRVKTISYRKFSATTYKQELLEALASGKGPDIFMINSTWEPSFRDKIVSAPAEVISEKMYRDTFVDLASDAFIVDGKINAVPLSVDSLALYYNKDLLAEAGFANPPVTWEELISMVPKLTRIDATGQILQSAIAMGTSKNINRATDVLGLLMLQNKTQMTDDYGRVIWSGSGGSRPAQTALELYTSFADKGDYAYTWNPSLHWSLDAFAEGKLAMMLNYSWHMETIRSKSPKLNFTVAPAPQISGYPKVNFGNCYGYVVALNKEPEVIGGTAIVKDESRVRETWKFLRYLTTGYAGDDSVVSDGLALGGSADSSLDPTQEYLEKTKKPAAKKNIIEKQKEVYELGVFAEQSLTAKNWRQENPDVTESIMGEMIDNVNTGKFELKEALKIAITQINRAISK